MPESSVMRQKYAMRKKGEHKMPNGMMMSDKEMRKKKGEKGKRGKGEE